jgi:hypothetical protein
MKKSILVAIVYIIIFAMEIFVYWLSDKDGAVYFYGFISLIAFMFTFGSTLFEQQ